MDMMLMTLSASLFLAIAAYAQFQIPRYARTHAGGGHSHAGASSGFRDSLGTGCIAGLRDSPALATIAFIIGFGAVHLPAAFILSIKDERGAENLTAAI